MRRAASKSAEARHGNGSVCEAQRILKPQMNAILNGLQNRGMLERIRSEADRRQVYLQLTKEGCACYERAHQELLALPQGLIERLMARKRCVSLPD